MGDLLLPSPPFGSILLPSSPRNYTSKRGGLGVGGLPAICCIMYGKLHPNLVFGIRPPAIHPSGIPGSRVG